MNENEDKSMLPHLNTTARCSLPFSSSLSLRVRFQRPRFGRRFGRRFVDRAPCNGLGV